jgi:hypothetical protein
MGARDDSAMTRRIGRQLDRQEGVVAVITALMLIVLMGSVAFAIDLARLRHERHVVQTAVDFGALAAAGLLPAEGPVEGTAARDMAVRIALANAPGITAADVNVTFRCVVQDPEGDGGQNSPDLAFACNQAGGGTFDDGGWRLRGKRALHVCDPFAGDKCNAVVVRAANTIPYFFAPVIGSNTGSTGSVAGAACKGFCGQPNKPLDVLLVLDRTASLSSTELQQVKDGAKAVLDSYDPTLHKVGVVVLPYGDPGIPEGTPMAGDPVAGCRTARNQFYPAVPPSSWRPAQMSPPLIAAPNPVPRPLYGPNNSSPWGLLGLSSDYSLIRAAIDCLERAPSGLDGNTGDRSAVWVDAPGGSVSYQARSGGHTNLSDPVLAAANILAASDPDVPDVMIFMSDGEANQPVGYNPCGRAVQFAANARAAASAAGRDLSVYTLAWGVNGVRCGQDTSGTYANAYATRMFAAMATQPSTANESGGSCFNPDGENNDGDYYYCLPSADRLDEVFRQIAVASIERARLIQFE